MYYVDSQRTSTRRDSSLIRIETYSKDVEALSLSQGISLAPAPGYNESLTSLMPPRPKGSVQRELVTMMFESMLDTIIESWEVITPPKPEDSIPIDIGKTLSDTMSLTATKKKKPIPKSSKTKKSQSRLGLAENLEQNIPIVWWSAPDEKAIIRFRNGNMYEGNISMKSMHGEGRFQWADGTIYLGQFRDNEMFGKGKIQWKDDTWYEGEFAGNLRHGQGLYVDSRLQRSYSGGWLYGGKHGEGVIYYSKTFRNSYDGQWIQNERFGYGSREYSYTSGFKGEWERNVREGKGLMIWPNGDFYRGEWKNGVMSGYGIYVWGAHYNNTMSLPSLKVYRGLWEKGQRNGYGVLNLGMGWGSFYKGEFKNNMKTGPGKFVSNNGLILQHSNLFIEDNLGPLLSSTEVIHRSNMEPYEFDICDCSVGLSYHIDKALKNIDRTEEHIAQIINDYIKSQHIITNRDEHHEKEIKVKPEMEDKKDFFTFEESSLRKALRCYETELKNIYYKYSKICNAEEIYFNPVMIRLYLWQFFYDCNVHGKGLTLYDLDIIFYENRDWCRYPHDPFEKIYFWQFVHTLILVASKLYAKRELPGPKPDTIVASAFRLFMEQDVLKSCNRHKGNLTSYWTGRLVKGYGAYIPLKAAYALYRTLGESHTIRTFLVAVRRAPHYLYRPQPPITDTPDEYLPLGRNLFIYGDEMSFIVDDNLPKPLSQNMSSSFRLFNFANLSNRTIIKIFTNIFPQIRKDGYIMDLNIKLTFYEFFEAFVQCTEESIKVKSEEMKFRQKMSYMAPMTIPVLDPPHSTPVGNEKGNRM